MDTVEALVGDLAWPVTVLLVLFLLRREARDIAAAIRDRVASNESDVSIGRAGIEIRTNVEALNARLVTVETGQGQYGELLLDRLNANSPAAATEPISDELRSLAEQYLTIQAADWNERVRLKNEAANRLGSYVVTHRISRDALANEHDEGLIIALASAVLIAPEKGDSRRLLAATRRINRLHVRYRILVALSRLIERRLLDPADVKEWQEVLARFTKGADAALLRNIKWTSSLFETAGYDA